MTTTPHRKRSSITSRRPLTCSRSLTATRYVYTPFHWTTYYDSIHPLALLLTKITRAQALAAAGITPSESKTYTLDAIHKALGDIHDGYAPYVSCDGDNLNELWYFYYVRGNLVTGSFEPAEKREFQPQLPQMIHPCVAVASANERLLV
jgi:hypothetical protein